MDQFPFDVLTIYLHAIFECFVARAVLVYCIRNVNIIEYITNNNIVNITMGFQQSYLRNKTFKIIPYQKPTAEKRPPLKWYKL